MLIDIEFIFSLIATLANIVLVIGIIVTFTQVKVAKDALKAQVIMKLIDEWRDMKTYQAMIYVNQLRSEWKSIDPSTKEWSKLAKEWVYKHAGKNPNSSKKSEQKLWLEWEKRRTASQFLSKMGFLIEAGYLSENDLFGVDPEVGRQLAVLIPIEIAVIEYWSQKEDIQIDRWDRPFPKLEFNSLRKRYEKWYKKREKDILRYSNLQ